MSTPTSGTAGSERGPTRLESEPTVPESETTVPTDETPAARCPHCERPFRTERLRALHVGDAHDEEWTDEERTAYDAATEDEADDLFVFHITVVGAITLLYAVLVLAYMVVLGAGL